MFECVAFLLLRLFIKSELPELCRITRLSLAASLWTTKLLFAHLQEGARGRLSVHCPAAGLSGPGLPASPPQAQSPLGVLVTADPHVLFTATRRASGPVLLHQLGLQT